MKSLTIKSRIGMKYHFIWPGSFMGIKKTKTKTKPPTSKTFCLNSFLNSSIIILRFQHYVGNSHMKTIKYINNLIKNF